MGVYRETRNILKSCMERIREILSDNSYTGVTVVQSFKQVYSLPFDPKQKTVAICVKVSNTIHQNWEVGSFLTMRKPLIIINIFASSGEQGEDIVDLLVDNLKQGFDYFEYTVLGGITENASYESGATSDGKINVDTISVVDVNLSDDKSSLDIHDRYRFQINLNCSKSKLE